MGSLHRAPSSEGNFPFANVPKDAEFFPVCENQHVVVESELIESQDLTSELYQIDNFPCAIGEHSDLFRARKIQDEKGNVSGVCFNQVSGTT